MKTINFLHIHIVCFRNLQLSIRWLLRITVRMWGSHALDVQVPLEFWRGLFSWVTSWISHGILVLVQFSAEMICLDMLHVFYSSYLWLQRICHEGQSHLRHHDLDMMHQYYCHDHHLGLTEVMRRDCLVRPGHACPCIHRRWMLFKPKRIDGIAFSCFYCILFVCFYYSFYFL